MQCSITGKTLEDKDGTAEQNLGLHMETVDYQRGIAYNLTI